MAESLWGDALPPVMPTHAKPERYMVPKEGDVNPCVALYGPGPAGARCGDCQHLHRLDYHRAIFKKCDLRKVTHGKATDHSARWLACAKYEPGKRSVQFVE